MVLHSSISGTELDKYILNINNTILRVLKKKQERKYDELTEIQTYSEDAGFILLYKRTIQIGRDLWRSPNQIICSKQGQLRFDWAVWGLFQSVFSKFHHLTTQSDKSPHIQPEFPLLQPICCDTPSHIAPLFSYLLFQYLKKH